MSRTLDVTCNIQWRAAQRQLKYQRQTRATNRFQSSSKGASSVKLLDDEAAKSDLKEAIVSTNRGSFASSSQRGIVEEAQVRLEALSEGAIDFNQLEGKWKLLYTTAPDVAPLLSLSRLQNFMPIQAGSIYQTFSSLAIGKVQNIINLSIPPFLEKEQGVTICVEAHFEARSDRRLILTFRNALIRDVRISKGFEAFLAPALFPRNWFNHRLLLAIKEFQLNVPLRQQRPQDVRKRFGSEYLLTYVDSDMLVGRQTGSGGSLIFERYCA